MKFNKELLKLRKKALLSLEKSKIISAKRYIKAVKQIKNEGSIKIHFNRNSKV